MYLAATHSYYVAIHTKMLMITLAGNQYQTNVITDSHTT